MNEYKNTNIDNFCFKYNKADIVLIFKAIGSFLIILLMFIMFVTSLEKNEIENIIIASFVMLAGIIGLYTELHRRFFYDEICIEDGYFIVKNKNIIKSKTLIKDINCVSHTSIIAMWDNAYIKMYSNKKLLFHYKESEFEEEEKDILNEIFKNQTKATR